MKKTLAALLSIALLGTAHAELYNFQYTGTVTSITYLVDWTSEYPLPSVMMPTGSVALGETVAGSFSYDTSKHGSAPITPSDKGASAYYFMDGPLEQHLMMFSGGSLSVGGIPSAGVIWVADNMNYSSGVNDSLSLYSYYFGADKQVLSLNLNDASDSILRSVALPGKEAAGFQSGTFGYEYSYAVEVEPGTWQSLAWRVKGNFNTFTQISAVPEPGTYAMLLAGLGIVGWRRRAARLN